MVDLELLYEAIMEMRSMIREGVVVGVSDTGQVQTVDVQTEDGMVHPDIEVLHASGDSGVAPVNGAVCTLLAVGGDPSNLRALPPRSPATRFGGQAQGERTISLPDGTRIEWRMGGRINILAATQVTVTAPDVVINVQDKATITGNLQLNGSLTLTGGDVTADGISLKQHTHPVEGSVTGPPTG